MNTLFKMVCKQQREVCVEGVVDKILNANSKRDLCSVQICQLWSSDHKQAGHIRQGPLPPLVKMSPSTRFRVQYQRLAPL